MQRKIWLLTALCVILSVLQTGCGGSTSSYDMADSVKEESYYEAPAMEESSMVNTSGSTAQTTSKVKQNNRKLIRTVELTVETDNYEELMTSLETEIESMGGYIELKDAFHGNLYSKYEGNRNRNASLTVRIPSNKLDEFTGKVGEIGNITFESESVEDVTLKYVDIASHKKMLQTQQDRLLQLMEEAETMEDIITIESRLSEIRYEIESMESQLRTYDNLVDYSTVRISINEVERYTPQPEKTIKDRILQGLSENTYRVLTGVLNFFVELIIALPILLLLAVIGIVLWLLFKGFRKLGNKGVIKQQTIWGRPRKPEESTKVNEEELKEDGRSNK